MANPGAQGKEGKMNEAIAEQEFKGYQRGIWGVFMLIFGVIIPLISIAIELVTGICAQALFDPIPTAGHLILAVFVPLSNLLVCVMVWKRKENYFYLVGLINAVAIGVGGYFTIIFLPLLPVAVIAIVFFGIGLLGIAPLFAFLSSLVGRRRLRCLTAEGMSRKVPGLGWGLALSLLIILLLQLPSSLTRIGMGMAVSDSPETSRRGVRWLQAIGNEEEMLRECYGRSRRPGGLIGLIYSAGNPVAPAEAQTVFYRVTGTGFNSLSPPVPRRGFTGWDVFGFDAGQGSDRVGGRLSELSLVASRIDGSIDAGAALAYTEWTLVFRNDSPRRQEARAQIVLPPGGVVSRLTLWIDGEEREAAFAGRGKVSKAYRKVVRRQRDPVLVTTCGRDRVLMQCFPVPPSGGEMKVRLGITAPLVIERGETGTLRFPFIAERNFKIPGTLAHSIWIESEEPLAGSNPAFQVAPFEGGGYSLRGSLPESCLSDHPVTVQISLPVQKRESWAFDYTSRDESVIRQVVEMKRESAPDRVVFVIDTSRSMQVFLPGLAEVISTLPDRAEYAIILAGEEVIEYSHRAQSGPSDSAAAVAARLKNVSCVGGCDNVRALERAWDIAAQRRAGVVVWLHGPQPVLLETAEGLKQRWERRPEGPRLLSLQVKNGPHLLLKELDGIRSVSLIPLMDDGEEAMKRLFSRWFGEEKQVYFQRERTPAKSMPLPPEGKTSSHLVRLWAFEEILKLYYEGTVSEAVDLARRYHLVTPVSGAVVLETEEQYREAGLEPVESGSVPSIPEPEFYLLVGVLMFTLLGAAIWRRRCESV